MLGALARSLFGTANDRVVKGFDRPVARINALEPEFAKLSDEQLRGKTTEFRERLAKGETLDDLLIEAFATVREAAKRTLGQRPFDVQLKGGMVLHAGKIAEMKTGEGKTLVATLPVYLNALEGKGVHVVTVNDYLARRDAEWMGKIYTFLGLTVGTIVHNLSDEERRAAYASDITYGTNNEIGFDYLRDNMKFRRDDMVQRPFNFAIVDEVDSILIDEARTPLIISGPAEDSSELYRRADVVIPRLKPDAYEKDEKNRQVTFTETGIEAVEDLLRADGLLPEGQSLYAPSQITLLHHVTQALRAHKLFARDVDYIVKDGQVVIIDEFTGRMMAGRRYSEGLHQALEAKEKVEIQRENQTLASITFQNLFRMYPKLAGMTGTAMTEAAEFAEIYKLEVVEIPTNVPVARKDNDDEVYRTLADKTRAIVKLIGECRDRNQPVLVGTVSIEKSEALSAELKKARIPHNVLNARYHEQEAEIVAQAGRPGAVTIATNMAGRGTDIQLGGNADMLLRQAETEVAARIPDETARAAELEQIAAKIRADVARDREIVRAAGGLYVVGTERHESRRIDNQLRGRSGRQGDPGGSKFFLSLEDDLMRIFGGNKVLDWVQKKGMADDEALTHRWLNKALETAQGKVEARNFEIRKNLLRFDDVMNSQRKEIYKERLELMATEDVADVVVGMRRDVVDGMVSRAIPEDAYAEQWKIAELKDEVQRTFGLDLPIDAWAQEEGIAEEQIKTRLNEAVDRLFAQKAAQYGPEVWRQVEKSVLMQLFDQSWKEHLLHLDHLRQGIGLRAYGQKDPLNEYKREAFNLFSDLLTGLRESVVNVLANLQLRMEPPPMPEPVQMHEIHEDPVLASSMAGEAGFDPAGPPGGGVATLARPAAGKAAIDPNNPSTWGKVARNAPCPCGSGRKFKHCHGRV
ncbi:preprotein translocase subunit SecA [Enhydrobacter sp.]|jgi:preprotein translocase subunit SecA|uniref:preprotein translocase subunit SecA n=1 Tax=Enhydrobacter sp. TaxID=1894999 RepID=UPI00262174CC|nr:preprotein translocase subunit SecA [Enhydrobacter sp.]WIM11865.1 MAG: Protein translocase subunit SecA [Enhydrobacter sp.]